MCTKCLLERIILAGVVGGIAGPLLGGCSSPTTTTQWGAEPDAGAGPAASSGGPTGSGKPATNATGASDGGTGGAASSGASSARSDAGAARTDAASGAASDAGSNAGTDAASVGPVNPANLPASCSAAANAYTVSATTLDSSVVPVQVPNYWGGTGTPEMRAMVAVDSTNKVYGGFIVQNGSSYSTVIAAEGSTAGNMITLPSAVLGGLATTSDGLGALLYDASTVDQRLWAQVKRLAPDGTEKFSTDLFRSTDLMADMSRGNPARGRLGYLSGTDELIAYFGHMQMLQGVRHQGGYVAQLSASGTQTVLNGWFGSHNIDQRLVVDGTNVGVLGLGDAYPVGFFFSFLSALNTNVVYTVAGNGQGDANGQIGGMFALSDVIVASFVTDKSISQTLSAGTWPNLDQNIAMQIANGAINGTDVGLLLIPKGSTPASVTPVWVNVMPSSGAHIRYLKSVQYGSSDLILLAWEELTGNQFAPTSTFYTMVVDRTGATCQPKQQLDAANGFTYDDIVRRPDGAVVWANGQGGKAHIVTLIP